MSATPRTALERAFLYALEQSFIASPLSALRWAIDNTIWFDEEGDA